MTDIWRIHFVDGKSITLRKYNETYLKELVGILGSINATISITNEGKHYVINPKNITYIEEVFYDWWISW